MKKFAEFTSEKLSYFASRPGRKRSRYTYRNLEEVLTPAQLAFLESKEYHLRPHPRNRSRYEIFFNVECLSERDETIIALLFDNLKIK